MRKSDKNKKETQQRRVNSALAMQRSTLQISIFKIPKITSRVNR